MKYSVLFFIPAVIAVAFVLSSVYSPSVSAEKNVFVQCDLVKDKHAKYECYNDSALYSLRHKGSVDNLFQYAEESEKNLHLKKHSIGRAALIVSQYDLDKAGERCMPDNCGVEYYHGMAEEWGTYAPERREEFADFIERTGICSLGLTNTYCYHIVGHLYKDLEKGLAFCNTLENEGKFSVCASGVLHQQFIDNVPMQALLEKCSRYTDIRKEFCYEYTSYAFPRWECERMNVREKELCMQAIPQPDKHPFDWIISNCSGKAFGIDPTECAL